MKRKKIFRNIATSLLIVCLFFSNGSAIAADSNSVSNSPELPESIYLEGREFKMDKSAGGGFGTATPDFDVNTKNQLNSSYRVLGSDVRLYIDYSHGHGGDHFAAGWVQATAPKFTARAEVWQGSRLVVTGTNNPNKGDIARAASHLAVGIVKDARPRIFYAW
ncbi:hypothetical protein [Virgibacillus halodenitrificans]|uniref:hypothetical protein n=1 Tax=Virgibacillus halodenitrificans TaxID=1482 RepID=UPI000EF44120|nr:hypothetical protein [Virgibacillus halodenitrificans]